MSERERDRERERARGREGGREGGREREGERAREKATERESARARQDRRYLVVYYKTQMEHSLECPVVGRDSETERKC